MKTLKEKLEDGRIITITNCWDTTRCPTSDRPMISEGRKRRNLRMSRVAYEVYIGPIPKGLLVCHTCDNPRCHNPEHLFIGTHSDNSQDMWNKKRHSISGGALPGEHHHGSKLTNIQVEEIRSSTKKGTVLSVDYGVSNATISRARRGVSWKHTAKSLSERLNP
jgi:hypothetical protein